MKIAMIGAGAMGGATVEGLIKGEMFRNEDITVSDPSQDVVNRFAHSAYRLLPIMPLPQRGLTWCASV